MRCRLCGGESERFTAAGLDYGDCPDCGFIELDEARLPEPGAERERYLLHENSSADSGYVAYIDAFLDAVGPFLAPGASVLDFGSGPAPVPAGRMAARGYAVSLYDPYFAPDGSWRARAWDAIVAHEVAEHLAEPGRAFAELASRLAPGSALCVRTRFRPGSREDFASWWYRSDPTHVGFFGERAFGLLADRLGLEPALVLPPDTVVLRKPR